MSLEKVETKVVLPINPTEFIVGNLYVPQNAGGMVIFAHGSGSGRFSPRNTYVADAFHDAQLGTLLIDLLTSREDEIDAQTREFRFDIPLLSERLLAAIDWISADQNTSELDIGLFGASTGAAAALIAAARNPEKVKAIVSRGGRTDLAGDDILGVRAPTLFITGENDTIITHINRRSLEQIPVEAVIKVVPEASHLFEEPGALEIVAQLASDWFKEYLLA